MTPKQLKLISKGRNSKNNYYLIFSILAITVAYGFFQARTLLHGPTLTVLSPKPGDTVTETLVEITGNTENVNQVSINGKIVTMNTTGEFTKKLVTPNGYGVILVEAKNRFGHHTEQRIEFVGKPAINNS